MKKKSTTPDLVEEERRITMRSNLGGGRNLTGLFLNDNEGTAWPGNQALTQLNE